MKVACIGCGVYSMGIASLLSDSSSNEVWMWAHTKDVLAQLKEQSKNFQLSISTDMQEVIQDASAVFILVSSPFFKETIQQMKNYVSPLATIYIGTKGMVETQFLTDFTKRILPNTRIYSFAGPTLAKDIYERNPVGFSLSGNDSLMFQNLMPSYIDIDFVLYPTLLETFCIYKNLMAIGAGIVMGCTNSYSSTLSFLTKALKELQSALFPQEQLISYGVVGDYFLTGTMKDSRNYSYGLALSQGNDLAQKFLEKNTVEGYQMLPLFDHYLKSKTLSLTSVTLLKRIVFEKEPANLLLDYIKKLI